MLNVRALNKLLTENVDHKVFVRWFIMTPNGSLMAYTLPANMKELRDQVALVSISWKEHLERKDSERFEPQYSQGGPNEAPKRVIRPNALETLTVEFDNRNLIVKYLQPKLLLVLEGGVPPGRKRELKVTAEAPDDARYPSEDSNGADRADTMLGTSVGSKASTTISSTQRLSVLHIQRRKMEMMAETIKRELSGFEACMPDDPSNKFF
ncbi:hypothetical protein D6D19_03124 [Aureobasidium pullulans]|uniref:Uncharacterized protein n=1 Tax=Aureobasidium pullulans TaxID=5580 RepID=A0A4S9BG58_AURPU|nr:hypothetical protein D6D21_03018 [Aureobasidium pullulans]THW76453.1 hypothetical protein D6D19_03124 [Aureobasidium pullulans]THW91363.1 hypothetical protein D6D15_03889 [Aureobasidium pullulans]THZ02538.1 hypothetical protein D6C92_00528 [Aureobasidium pullulans]THZ25401.1 hypothetical protein D6C91_02969 [Aureobasidium pullulans]